MLVNGLYTGIEYELADLSNPEAVKELDDLINNAISAGLESTMVCIVMYPAGFVGQYTSHVPEAHLVQIPRPTSIGNYTPRNKKLLTFPYNFLIVDTGNDAHTYRYEWSTRNDHAIEFELSSAISPDPEVLVAPMTYDGFSVLPPNISESVVCKGFPQCACTVDSFRAWVAQRGASSIFNTIATGVASYGGMALATTPVGMAVAGTAGIIGIASNVSSLAEQATTNTKAKGSQGSSTEVANRYKGVIFKRMGVTVEYARMIDDYFDRYGYNCCRIKIPNRNVRPHWTYTKTKDVAIRGNVPVDDMRKIKTIYNNGITFWRNGSEVGNYSLDNSV